MKYENIMLLKKIDKKELEKRVIDIANSFYGFASNDFHDYICDIVSHSCDFVKEDDMFIECIENHIEFTKVESIPEIVKWYDVYYYENEKECEKRNDLKHEIYFY